MAIIYLSDFDLAGSGYMNLSVALCSQLAERGYDVIALGLGYKRDEHHYPFSIVPVDDLRQVAPMISQLKAHGVPVEAIVTALDIPLQEKIAQQIGIPGDIPYIGLFPLEAGPLCGPWALSLLKMDERLIMSRFGQAELALKAVDSQFIPLAIDNDLWRPPYEEERARLRKGLGIEDGTFAVLTVADNQERKNLSRSMEIFADFAKDHKAQYWLVTRPDSPVGWKLEDYALDLGIMDRFRIYRRGMSAKDLWGLYAAADCFLLTSKAEGLAIPVLEAMACRLPVVGTGCAAIEEHLADGRGLMIEPDYVYIDPFGNGRRYLASREDGAYKLALLKSGFSPEDYRVMLNKAQDYITARTWQEAGDVLEAAIKKVTQNRSEYRRSSSQVQPDSRRIVAPSP